jgi:hypothetical protein
MPEASVHEYGYLCWTETDVRSSRHIFSMQAVPQPQLMKRAPKFQLRFRVSRRHSRHLGRNGRIEGTGLSHFAKRLFDTALHIRWVRFATGHAQERFRRPHFEFPIVLPITLAVYGPLGSHQEPNVTQPTDPLTWPTRLHAMILEVVVLVFPGARELNQILL